VVLENNRVYTKRSTMSGFNIVMVIAIILFAKMEVSCIPNRNLRMVEMIDF